MTDPVTQSLGPSLLDNLELQQAVKDFYDASVQFYADNGLLPQSLADEMTRNMTGAEVMKFVLAQQEDHRQIHSQYNPNPFCYSRPDILAAHICAMRAGCQIGIDLGEGRDFTPTED